MSKIGVLSFLSEPKHEFGTGISEFQHDLFVTKILAYLDHHVVGQVLDQGQHFLAQAEGRMVHFELIS